MPQEEEVDVVLQAEVSDDHLWRVYLEPAGKHPAYPPPSPSPSPLLRAPRTGDLRGPLAIPTRPALISTFSTDLRAGRRAGTFVYCRTRFRCETIGGGEVLWVVGQYTPQRDHDGGLLTSLDSSVGSSVGSSAEAGGAPTSPRAGAPSFGTIDLGLEAGQGVAVGEALLEGGEEMTVEEVLGLLEHDAAGDGGGGLVDV